MTRLAAILVMAGLAACNPTLMARSSAPPGRSARFDEVHGFWGIKGYRLKVSAGVALAFSCHRGGPCRDMTVTSDDSTIAEVRPASLAELERTGLSNQAPAAAAVIVGKAPGMTRIRVGSDHGGRVIEVTVVAN